MSENETSAPGAGENGASAPGVASDGNQAAAVTANDGADTGNGNERKGGPGEEDNLDDWKDPRAAKQRFTTLSDQKREADEAARKASEQAAYYRGLAEGKTTGDSGRQPAARQDANPEPDAKDKAKYTLGEDDPRFIEDRALWRLRNENARLAADSKRSEAAKADFETRRGRFMTAREAATKNADTPNAAKQLGEMPVQFADEIVQSAQSALIAEHLAGNKAEYDALLREHVRFDADGNSQWRTPQSATAFARKIGALESSLPGVFAARKLTKAGTPPATVGAGAGAGGAKKLSDMDVDELDAHIKKLKAGNA